jgi:hypothetical protein
MITTVLFWKFGEFAFSSMLAGFESRSADVYCSRKEQPPVDARDDVTVIAATDAAGKNRQFIHIGRGKTHGRLASYALSSTAGD